MNGSSCSQSTDTLACLRAVDVDVLATVNNNIGEDAFYGTYVFVPVVDGTLIPERPSVILRQGVVNGVRFFHIMSPHL